MRAGAWFASAAVHVAAAAVLCNLGGEVPLAPPAPPPLVWVEPGVPAPPVGAAARPASAPAPPPPARPRRPTPPARRPRAPAPAAKEAPLPAADAARDATPDGAVGGTAGSPGDTPIPAARVAAPPVALERVLPRYPPQARARGLEGRVLLRAIIDRLGHVEPEVEVRESIAMLDAAAIEALRRWRFSPGRDAGGDTVRVLVEVPMRFQLR